MKTALVEARAAVDVTADAGRDRRPRPVAASGSSGCVAARLVEDLGRPAVVGAELGGSIRASCRSDGSLDLGAALERLRRPLHPVRRPRRRRRVRDRRRPTGTRSASGSWRSPRRRAPRRPARPARGSTWSCPALESTTPSCRELAGLAPYGPGNPEPLVAVLGPDGDPCPGRDRRAQPAHAAARPRRHRRDRVRPARPRRGRPARGTGSTSSRGWSAGGSAGFEIAPARDPRRRPGRPPRRPARRRGRRLARRRRSRGSAHDARPARRRAPRDPYGVGPVRALIAPVAVGRRAPRRRLLHAEPAQRPGPARRGARRRTGQLGRRRPGRHADRRPVERGRRRTRGGLPGLDRLRQGRQHLDPVGQGRPPAHDGRHGLDAVVVAGRQAGLLRPDRRARSGRGRRRASRPTT